MVYGLCTVADACLKIAVAEAGAQFGVSAGEIRKAAKLSAE
jgi:hypothetical protein